MDLNSLASDKKHEKRCKAEEKHERSICDLPDHILQYTISFLPTKDAFRTSLVSQRWVHLWKGISKIELEFKGDQTREKRKQFIDFVKRLLVACDCAADLKRFSLSFIVGRDGSLVSEWLRGFINPDKIQELRLNFIATHTPTTLPNHLFRCATLTQFHLRMYPFTLPPSIHFQSLRTLTLENVIFPSAYLTQQLFNGCPSLEELKLINCNWMNVKSTVTISSPLLQKILVREPEGWPTSYGCQVVIIGTNLEAFSYEGPTGSFVFKLLTKLSSLETLRVSHHSVVVISCEPSLPGPLFPNLAELSLLSKLHAPLSRALLTILRNSPRLHVINFEAGGVYLPERCENYQLDPLPICFGTHLKTIRINRFSGIIMERDAIKVLLQSASVLDKLYISWRVSGINPPWRSEFLKTVSKQIESFPRGSKDCVIHLEYY